MPSYSSAQRSRVPELMDTEVVAFEEFAKCLRDIERINTATNAHAPTLAWLRARWAASSADRPFRILDVGSGYGGTLRAIAREARRCNVAVELVGIDINPWAKRAAAAVTRREDGIRFETADLFEWNDGDYDAIISALFVHHLDDAGALAFLRWMHTNARSGWFVNDLHRHKLPFFFIAAMARLFRLHRFVRNDAPLSVARAFRRRDWESMIAGAMLVDERSARVRWVPLFRYCVAWER